MRLASTLIAFAAVASAAAADSGNGKPPRATTVTGGEPSIDRLGQDVVRFSKSPALGGHGMSLTAVAEADGSARATVRFYRGHPNLGWRREAQVTFRLDHDEWQSLRAASDRYIDVPEPRQVTPDGSIVVCTDGPGYLHERWVARKARWMTGFCGTDHPNNAMAKAASNLVIERIARF